MLPVSGHVMVHAMRYIITNSANIMTTKTTGFMLWQRARRVKTKEGARSIAIEWQHWACEQSLSYGELAEWSSLFLELARKFHLVREFKENAII